MIEGLRTISDDFQLKSITVAIDTVKNADQCSEEWEIAIEDITMYILKNNKFDQLQQLVIQGPVEDGDVISKVDRDILTNFGLAVRVMHRGQWGYTSATYLGGFVMKACFISNETQDAFIKSKLK